MLPIQLKMVSAATDIDEIGSRTQDKAKTQINLQTEDHVSQYTDVTESDTFLGDKIEF